jgi:hypothetical protein
MRARPLREQEEITIMRLRSSLFLALTLTVLATLAVAQQPRVSPPGTAEATVAGKKIKIDYNRPKVADPKTGQPRTIMGGLVPYGKVWRTGANEATHITTETDLEIGGYTVPAGRYTLFTIPGEDGWTLIINRQTGQWGTEHDAAQDLARIPMKVKKLDETVEQFTISVEAKEGKQGVLRMAWEKTQASVPFTVK